MKFCLSAFVLAGVVVMIVGAYYLRIRTNVDVALIVVAIVLMATMIFLAIKSLQGMK